MTRKGNSLLAELREEWTAMWQGKFPRGLFIFLTPLLFTLLFGWTYSKNVVNHIPLAVLDEDQTALSRSLSEMFADSDRFHLIAYPHTEGELAELLQSGKVLAALEIPKDFSKKLKNGEGASLVFLTNSINNVHANGALTSTQEIIRTFNIAAGQQAMERAGLLPSAALNATYPIQMGVRILGNPTVGYAPFMLSGLLLNGLQIGLMAAFAPVAVTEYLRRKGENPLALIAACLVRLLPYFLCGIIAYLLSLIICCYVFDVPMRGSWAEALVLGAAYYAFVGGVLLLFSICSPTREMALQQPMLYIMPGLLYSGLSWPSFDMTPLAHFLSRLLPITYAGESLRDILLTGYAPTLWADIRSMLLGALLTCTVAALVFFLRPKIEERLQRARASRKDVSHA